MKKTTEDYLLELATKLGTTVEHLYGVLVKQSRVWAIEAICSIFGWLLATVILFFISLQCHYVPAGEYDFATWPTVLMIVSYGVTMVSFFIFISDLSDNVGDIATAWFNPEYFAVDRLVNMIGR